MEATNTSERPPLHRVVRGTILKGRTVTTPYATTEDLQRLESARPSERQVAVRDVETAAEATVKLANIERFFRTAKEREMGRDFTPDEAAAEKQEWELRYTRLTEQRSRQEIHEGIEAIAQRLERAAEDVRRELAHETSDPATKFDRVQHTVAWLFPNLGAHSLTSTAITWTVADGALKRMGSPEPAEKEPTVS